MWVTRALAHTAFKGEIMSEVLSLLDVITMVANHPEHYVLRLPNEGLLEWQTRAMEKALGSERLKRLKDSIEQALKD